MPPRLGNKVFFGRFGGLYSLDKTLFSGGGGSGVPLDFNDKMPSS